MKFQYAFNGRDLREGDVIDGVWRTQFIYDAVVVRPNCLGIIYLTPARKYETMLATKTALPVLEHRQSQSHNLIDRIKEKIKS